MRGREGLWGGEGVSEGEGRIMGKGLLTFGMCVGLVGGSYGEGGNSLQLWVGVGDQGEGDYIHFHLLSARRGGCPW